MKGWLSSDAKGFLRPEQALGVYEQTTLLELPRDSFSPSSRWLYGIG